MNEKLAVLTAFEKAIDTPLNDAKAEAKDEMTSLFLEHGVTQSQLSVLGNKVGTISFTPPKNQVEIYPGEEQAALEWMLENDLAEIKPKAGWRDSFRIEGDVVIHNETGEVIPWLFVGMKPGYTTVRLSPEYSKHPERVIDMAAPLLSGGIAGLLEE